MLTQNLPVIEIVLDAKVRDMEGLEKKKKKGRICGLTVVRLLQARLQVRSFPPHLHKNTIFACIIRIVCAVSTCRCPGDSHTPPV